MYTNSTNFISEKIDIDTNIIWFEKSNKYILVNDLSNNLILNSIDSNKFPIKKSLLDQNDINTEKLNLLNNDIKKLLKECNRRIDKKKTEESKQVELKLSHYSKFKFNNKVAKVEYSNENLRNLIDPKFIHLKTHDKEDISFKIVERNKKIYLYKNEECLGYWGTLEMHEFQGKISMELTSFFHSKNDSDWTAVFHGSTLSKKNDCLMLTGESGKGKSSLSAILMANNYSLIADDFSPMNVKGIHFNFPSAISIKEGFYSVANDLFESFKDLNEFYISDIKGNVKYLPSNKGNKLVLCCKCNIIIDVSFGMDLKNELKVINKGNALEKILPDAWISNDKNHVKSFINWVKSSTFYKLSYNNMNIVEKMINKVF